MTWPFSVLITDVSDLLHFEQIIVTPSDKSDAPYPAKGVYWVYVIESLVPRYAKNGRKLRGFFYVGMTTHPDRRLRQHNGEIVGGGRYTSKHRPWQMRVVYGPYFSRSEALKAEYALKHSKRGEARLSWKPDDSAWCRTAYQIAEGEGFEPSVGD